MLLSIGADDLDSSDPALLNGVGTRVQETTRTADLAAYLGHGRFVVLLLGANLQGARIAADRLEVALGELPAGPLSIGLAMYRRSADNRLEMIGKNWIKHAWAAAAQDDCNLGCDGSFQDSLQVGCADTYSTGANGSRYYLGPRTELNPFTAAWGSCGSYFDATPVDCERDYFGAAANDVEHRLRPAQ